MNRFTVFEAEPCKAPTKQIRFAVLDTKQGGKAVAWCFSQKEAQQIANALGNVTSVVTLLKQGAEKVEVYVAPDGVIEVHGQPCTNPDCPVR